MTIYDELVARGLIAQVTDEKEIKDLINNAIALDVANPNLAISEKETLLKEKLFF